MLNIDVVKFLHNIIYEIDLRLIKKTLLSINYDIIT